MPANKGLEPVFTTELRTREVAEWLMQQLNRVARNAPEGSQEQSLERSYEKVSNLLNEYMRSRSMAKEERDKHHLAMLDGVSSALSDLRSSLNGHSRAKSSQLDQPFDAGSLEASITALIERGDWAFCCDVCQSRTERNMMVLGEKKVCSRCKTQHTALCKTCEKRLFKEEMTRAVQLDGEAFFCSRHVPTGMKSCTVCRCAYMGRPNVTMGNLNRADLKAQGISACPNCSAALAKLDCGHWSTDGGHRQALTIDTEDDNRDRDNVRENTRRVCGKCYAPPDGDTRKPEYFRPEKDRVQGGLFLDIGSKRSFGVELEFCSVQRMPGMASAIKENWASKEDGSLPRGGVELASTILHGDEGLRTIKQLCDYASQHEWKVDARGGFHLHIGLTDDSAEQVAAIAMGYLMTYDVWRHLVAPSRSLTCKYCGPTNCIPADLLMLDSMRYITYLTGCNDRRVWCNWHSYAIRRTVEIRIHQATKVYDKVANWVKAHARFCDWCSLVGNPKEIHDTLNGMNTHKLFNFLAAKAWNDQELAAWFMGRANDLHGVGNELANDVAKVVKEPEYWMYAGSRCYVHRDTSGGGFLIGSNRNPGDFQQYINASGVPSLAGPTKRFLTKKAAVAWLSANGGVAHNATQHELVNF